MLRRIFILNFYLSSLLLGWGEVAEARLVFSTEEAGVHANAFYIDSGDTASDHIDLEFGTALDAKLRYDVSLDRFFLNRDLQVNSNLLINASAETIDSDGGAFSIDGGDVFVADELAVEGAIYTDDTGIKYHFVEMHGCVRGSASTGTVGGGNSPVVRFDAGGNSQMRCSLPVPDDWVSGTDINIQTYWSASDNTTGEVDFDLEYGLFGVGDVISGGAFTDTIGGATYTTVNANTQLEIQELIEDIPAVDISANDMLNFNLHRTPGDAGDTYAADINIHMIRIAYTGKKLK